MSCTMTGYIRDAGKVGMEFQGAQSHPRFKDK